jgi:hypothetical protein
VVVGTSRQLVRRRNSSGIGCNPEVASGRAICRVCPFAEIALGGEADEKRSSFLHASDFMHSHSAFDRYREFYPRRIVNYTKIAIRVTVMNKVQFLLASEPRKPLKPRSLYVICLVEKDVRVKRRRACDYHHHKKIQRQ